MRSPEGHAQRLAHLLPGQGSALPDEGQNLGLAPADVLAPPHGGDAPGQRPGPQLPDAAHAGLGELLGGFRRDPLAVVIRQGVAGQPHLPAVFAHGSPEALLTIGVALAPCLRDLRVRPAQRVFFPDERGEGFAVRDLVMDQTQLVRALIDAADRPAKQSGQFPVRHARIVLTQDLPLPCRPEGPLHRPVRLAPGLDG